MVYTDLSAQRNGFAFANSFLLSDDERARLTHELAPAVDASLALVGPLGLGARLVGARDGLTRLLAAALPQHYGLCGGMAFAALDYYFHADAVMPRGSAANDQPPPGSPLRDYLWRRLLDSWTLNGPAFLELTVRLHLLPTAFPFRGGARGVGERSRQAWRTLRASIDANVPIPIGLIGVDPDPFLDHQVVAIGYEGTSETSGTIMTYDMNCPGKDQTIAFEVRTDGLTASESCPRGSNALRAFFCERYVAQVPPPI